jgi:hypothetical protein
MEPDVGKTASLGFGFQTGAFGPIADDRDEHLRMVVQRSRAVQQLSNRMGAADHSGIQRHESIAPARLTAKCIVARTRHEP